jgi:hypothetical protein
MTIDERLQFLLQSTESLHASLALEVQTRREQGEEHDQRWQRLNSAIKAAVLAYFSDGGANS